MPLIVRLCGYAAVLTGLYWVAQGLGVTDWSLARHMVNQNGWASWGVSLSVFGAALILIGRRM